MIKPRVDGLTSRYEYERSSGDNSSVGANEVWKMADLMWMTFPGYLHSPRS